MGKSCLLLQFLEGKFKLDNETTIGVEFGSRTVDLDDTLPILFEAIGMSPEVKGRSNVTGETINRYVELTPALAARLRAESPLDVMLYSAVGRLQDASISRLQRSND